MNLKLAPSDYDIYIPISEWIEKNIKEWLFTQRPLFKKLSTPIDNVLNSLDTLFNFIPFPLVIVIFCYFAFKKSTLAAGLISSAPKPKLIFDFVALGIFTALVFFDGMSIQTTSSPNFKAPTVQLGVQV